MKIQKYIDIINKIKEIITGTQWENHVFTVGGCVRDQIMGKDIKDIDLVVDIPNGGIDFAKWLEKNNYTEGTVVTYENFGTVMFHLSAFPDVELEAVHTRSECYHDAKTRNPETSFGSMKEDWQRRDFTINAIYYDISNQRLIDFDDRGISDIKNKIIRTCGEPDIIFQEDSLRILRMIRFASRLNFEIDDNTFNGAKRNVDRLTIISGERITDEFTKMLTFSKESAIKSLCLLWDIQGFNYVIHGFNDLNMEKRFEIIESLKRYFTFLGYKKLNDNQKIASILACLLYHTKEPSCGIDKLIKIKLQNHLKYSNDVTELVTFLYKTSKELESICNQIYIAIEEKQYSIRKIMNQCGNKELFLLSTIIGSDKVRDVFHTTTFDMPTLFEEFDDLDKMFYTYKLPIDGEDVMKVFNINPSAEVKKILDRVFMFACVNPDNSGREDCFNYLKSLKKIKDEWGEY